MNTFEHAIQRCRMAVKIYTVLGICLLALTAATHNIDGASPANADEHTSSVFQGTKVNAGTVTHRKEGKLNILTLSDDFVVPDTPDPHWQVVDAKGTVYLLQKLNIKEDKINTSIVVPDYVRNVAKVQIWCAWAEALLGEASFEKPVS